MLAGSAFARTIQEKVPQARIIELESESEFFEDPTQLLDALLTSAEGGSAWTLIHPNYTVVNPMPRPMKLPLTYPYGGPDPRFEQFLEHWTALKQKDGTVEQLYDYWILGRGAQAKEPRWSVMRDVLQWVD